MVAVALQPTAKKANTPRRGATLEAAESESITSSHQRDLPSTENSRKLTFRFEKFSIDAYLELLYTYLMTRFNNFVSPKRTLARRANKVCSSGKRQPVTNLRSGDFSRCERIPLQPFFVIFVLFVVKNFLPCLKILLTFHP